MLLIVFNFKTDGFRTVLSILDPIWRLHAGAETITMATVLWEITPQADHVPHICVCKSVTLSTKTTKLPADVVAWINQHGINAVVDVNTVDFRDVLQVTVRDVIYLTIEYQRRFQSAFISPRRKGLISF